MTPPLGPGQATAIVESHVITTARPGTVITSNPFGTLPCVGLSSSAFVSTGPRTGFRVLLLKR